MEQDKKNELHPFDRLKKFITPDSETELISLYKMIADKLEEQERIIKEKQAIIDRLIKNKE